MTNTLDHQQADSASQPDDQISLVPKSAAATKSFDASAPSDADTMKHEMDADAGDKPGKPDELARRKISKLLKDKEQEWTQIVQKKGPLQLLDLPLDVLKEIVKEVRLADHCVNCVHDQKLTSRPIGDAYE